MKKILTLFLATFLIAGRYETLSCMKRSCSPDLTEEERLSKRQCLEQAREAHSFFDSLMDNLSALSSCAPTLQKYIDEMKASPYLLKDLMPQIYKLLRASIEWS